MGSSSTADPVTRADAASAVHDFDFYMGSWHVHHRRLRERLAGNDEWQAFEGTSTAWPILGGAGNLDDNVLELPAGTYRAISLRSFDPQTGRWSIWWLDGRNPGRLDPPVVGGFEDGVGTFFCDDTFNGARSSCASSGPTLRRPRAAGSRRSRRMGEGPGRSTGSWSPAGSGDTPSPVRR